MGLNEEHTFGIPLQKFNLNLISTIPTPFSKQCISCFKLYCVQNILFFCLYQCLILDFKKVKKDLKNHLYLRFSSYIFLIPRLQNSFTVYLIFKFPHKDVKYVKDLKVNHKYAQTTLNIHKL